MKSKENIDVNYLIRISYRAQTLVFGKKQIGRIINY